MSRKSFEEEWACKVDMVRQSRFWAQVSRPSTSPIPVRPTRARRKEITVDAGWAVVAEGDLEPDGPAHIGMEDLRRFTRTRFSTPLPRKPLSAEGPCIRFVLRPARSRGGTRWSVGFDLHVEAGSISVYATSEESLLRASLYLSNYWSLRRGLSLPMGQRRVRPSVSLHLGADLWGGFCTTQAWIHGRETDTNFLELARMGINAVPIMAVQENYVVPDPSGKFRSLANPEAGENLARLARLARQASRYDIRVFLMAYSPKLPPDHHFFKESPQSRGALQSGGAFRALCSSHRATRKFLVDSWASLFREIPELGGILAITGGEGFYHCFTRGKNDAEDCPRCSRRSGPEVVAEYVNDVARGIRAENPEALLVTWPYSATHWSHDRDQEDFIARLDPEHVIFQTEIDKDSVDWRPAGYAKHIWNYSVSRITTSDRCRRQRGLCRERGLPFSTKIECNTSIECLNVPYLPALENQLAIWQNARRLQPWAIHSRWLFDGSCKSPSEELGYWAIWGRGTEWHDLRRVLRAMAERDFGPPAAPFVRKAWRLFSQALRHHPALDYYIGSYFIGPGQPLVLDPDVGTGDLDPAFFGRFYWLAEVTPTDDASSVELMRPLFYRRPGFRAVARRGPNRGQDVALEELCEVARLWERGAAKLSKARELVPVACLPRFKQEWALGQHLAYTWRSAAHVEEFLRLRDVVREFSGHYPVRSGHVRENVRDLDRMREIAIAERDIARKDLALVRGIDFLDLSLRLDLGTASTEAILKAKIRQIDALLSEELARWREELQEW